MFQVEEYDAVTLDLICESQTSTIIHTLRDKGPTLSATFFVYGYVVNLWCGNLSGSKAAETSCKPRSLGCVQGVNGCVGFLTFIYCCLKRELLLYQHYITMPTQSTLVFTGVLLCALTTGMIVLLVVYHNV